MARNSVTRSIARITRPLRTLFTRRELARWTRGPRTLLTGGGVGERIIELENRFERLQRGWNQHIPSLLDSMSDALDAAHRAEDGHRRMDAIREDLDRLSSRLELHLIDAQSSRSGLSGEIRNMAGVTLMMAGRKGVILAPSALDLPVRPGSIDLISVDASFGLPGEVEGLDAILVGWFALLAPDGQLKIDRFHLIVTPEPSAPSAIDIAALRRASASGGIMGSPGVPTSDQIIRSMERCGYRVEPSVVASDGLAQTLIGRRSAEPRA